MSARTLLVTGFEPFGGEAVNASWAAAKQLDGWRCETFAVASQQIPCAYGVCIGELARAFKTLRPSALMLTGQAARRTLVCVERIARNEASATAPDNRGVIHGLSPPGPGPAWLETGAPVSQISRAIREAGVSALVSTNAGDYVCNHLYYGALAMLRDLAPETLAVFIHLPATPDQLPRRSRAKGLPPVRAARALQAAAQALMRR